MHYTEIRNKAQNPTLSDNVNLRNVKSLITINTVLKGKSSANALFTMYKMIRIHHIKHIVFYYL